MSWWKRAFETIGNQLTFLLFRGGPLFNDTSAEIPGFLHLYIHIDLEHAEISLALFLGFCNLAGSYQ